MKTLFALTFAILLSFTAHTAFAQDVITDTVTIPIDGITRTLTVAFTTTGVVSVDVAPISDTFKVTATEWLSALWAIIEPINLEAEGIDAEAIDLQFNDFLTATETVPYPSYYTPFVRQYRFAIHICRNFVWNHEWAHSQGENVFGFFVLGPYFTVLVACREQYQDAYVELERIAHPLR